MQGQRDARSRAMTTSVKQQLGGLASNPGTDVPQPILRMPGRMSVIMPAGWFNRTDQERYEIGAAH